MVYIHGLILEGTSSKVYSESHMTNERKAKLRVNKVQHVGDRERVAGFKGKSSGSGQEGQ